ncbi:MAG: beta-galactosidase [Clostridia bacterium]|nr:beta-galactosidase [Clostridia bacterium]
MNFQALQTQKLIQFAENAGDDRIKVTNQMLLKDGKAWIPVMGEMHYSRVPCERWEENLQKMKEGGIDVVASYVFWIHHEEQKGEFVFSGNRDIRHFIELCHKTGLAFCLRIGPWAHGECRNGGFPDWLQNECSDILRSRKEPYISYVRRYINKIAEQVKGLPLFAIQIENELTEDPDYIEQVRQFVTDAGLHAPLYTATGWGRAKLPETVLPMYGAYPEAPWTNHIKELDLNPNYFFSLIREDNCIGSDILGTSTNRTDSRDNVPFMTCEMGGGNQITYHRRPLINSRDIEALVICKLGSGVNLLGYYMYCGGLNPIGLTTMQESKASGYPNDCPVISYDFQAPVGDMGQLRESYFRLSFIHSFLHSFGEMLAPMTAIMPDQAPSSKADTKTLRCALRSDGNSGFLFVNNHIRLHKMPAHPAHDFNIVFNNRTVSFSLDIPEDSSFFIPVNVSVGGLDILYATAQPVSFSENRLELLQIAGLDAVVSLANGQTYPLAPGLNRIHDTDVVLLQNECYEKSELHKASVSAVPKCCDPDLLLGHLPIEDKTDEYKVYWTDEDKWLVIKAKGNIAGFFVNRQLVSDFYLNGDSWVIDLRNISEKNGIIKIQPLSDTDVKEIYTEIPLETGTHIPEVYTCKNDRLFV